MLSDIENTKGQAAVVQLCGSCEFPPTISQIRAMALNLAQGRVAAPSAWEAWEMALQGHYDALGTIGKRALDVIGGSWAIKNTESPGVERSNFIKAYTEFMDRHRAELLAIPEVKQFAAASAQPDLPRLSQENTDHDHTQDPDFEPVTPEMIKNILSKIGFGSTKVVDPY